MRDAAEQSARLQASVDDGRKSSICRRIEQACPEQAGPSHDLSSFAAIRSYFSPACLGGLLALSPAKIARLIACGPLLHESVTHLHVPGPSVQMLDVQLLEGQSLLVVGPSGCGKSSLLRAISGALDLSSAVDKSRAALLHAPALLQCSCHCLRLV